MANASSERFRRSALSLARTRGAALAGLLGVSLLFVSGCSAILAGGAAGSLETFSYSYNNIARKSFTTEINALRDASVSALKEMAIRATDPVPTEKGFRILGVTASLHIQIDLERVTDRVSQIAVNAKKGYVKKDYATAAEIIRRTETALKRKTTRTAMRKRK